jgi:hypothetical protein
MYIHHRAHLKLKEIAEQHPHFKQPTASSPHPLPHTHMQQQQSNRRKPASSQSICRPAVAPRGWVYICKHVASCMSVVGHSIESAVAYWHQLTNSHIVLVVSVFAKL